MRTAKRARTVMLLAGLPILMTSLLTILPTTLHGYNHYTGPAGGVWTDPGNWGNVGYPGSVSSTDDWAYIRTGDDVNLNNPVANPLTGLYVDTGGILRINGGSSLNAGTTNAFNISTAGAVIQAGGLMTAPHGTGVNLTSLTGGTYTISGGTLDVTTLRIARDNSSAACLVDLSDTGVINVSGILSVAGGTNSHGTLDMSGGTINLTGTASMEVKGVGSGSSLFVQSGGVVNNSGQDIPLQGVSGLQGEFRLTGGEFNANGGSINNSGLLSGQAKFTMTGGTLNMGGGDLLTSRENSAGANGQVVTVTGGTITGVNELWGGVRLDGPSATLIVGSNPTGVSVTTIPQFNRGELQLLDGTVVFPVFGNGSANSLSRLTGSGSAILDLTGGQIYVDIASGYTPTTGDSFDLVDGNLAGELSTTNISGVSDDGIWQITWDTSQWESDGILTIVTAKIPEPGTFALLGLLAFALGHRRHGTTRHQPA